MPERLDRAGFNLRRPAIDATEHAFFSDLLDRHAEDRGLGQECGSSGLGG